MISFGLLSANLHPGSVFEDNLSSFSEKNGTIAQLFLLSPRPA
jgi:hypothetical protein